MENFGNDMPEDSTEKEVVDVAKIKSPLTEEEDTFDAALAAVAAEEDTTADPAKMVAKDDEAEKDAAFDAEEITVTAPAPSSQEDIPPNVLAPAPSSQEDIPPNV